MARRKRDTVFAEAKGKTVESIRYEEDPDYLSAWPEFSISLICIWSQFLIELGARFLRLGKSTSSSLGALMPLLAENQLGSIRT